METSFEQFVNYLANTRARATIGLEMSDAEAERVAADEHLARAYYQSWLSRPPVERSVVNNLAPVAPAAPAAREQSGPTKSRAGVWVGVIAMVVLAGLVIAATSNRKPVYDEVSAYTYCQLRVRDALKSPSTAEFSGLHASGSDGEWVAGGVVDSQNSFGAVMRSTFQCTITGGDQIRIDYIE